jgi:hypothetical protein
MMDLIGKKIIGSDINPFEKVARDFGYRVATPPCELSLLE